jgi:hypothetical protein
MRRWGKLRIDEENSFLQTSRLESIELLVGKYPLFEEWSFFTILVLAWRIIILN